MDGGWNTLSNAELHRRAAGPQRTGPGGERTTLTGKTELAQGSRSGHKRSSAYRHGRVYTVCAQNEGSERIHTDQEPDADETDAAATDQESGDPSSRSSDADREDYDASVSGATTGSTGVRPRHDHSFAGDAETAAVDTSCRGRESPVATSRCVTKAGREIRLQHSDGRTGGRIGDQLACRYRRVCGGRSDRDRIE